jgi:hypothetical protein
VEVQRRGVPADWPPGRFDLLVISELGYYLNPVDLRALWDAATHALEPGGTLRPPLCAPLPRRPVCGEPIRSPVHPSRGRGAHAVAGMVGVADWSEHPPITAECFQRIHPSITGHHHVHGANLGISARAPTGFADFLIYLVQHNPHPAR